MATRSPHREALPPGGIYVLLIRLPVSRRLRVGRLGSRTFAAGWYCYVGSAQRALAARLDRHFRRRKRRRWHIDRLTVAARPAGAWVVEGPRSLECRLAACLGRWGEVVEGFGSSDCRCPGHLLWFGSRGRAEAAVLRCWRVVGSPGSVGGRGLLWWPASGEGQDFWEKGLTVLTVRL